MTEVSAEFTDKQCSCAEMSRFMFGLCVCPNSWVEFKNAGFFFFFCKK